MLPSATAQPPMRLLFRLFAVKVVPVPAVTPVPVVTVKVVPLVMAVMNSLAGRPVPVTGAPTNNPVVDGTVTILLAATVLPPVSVRLMSGLVAATVVEACAVTPVPVVTVKVVALVMAVMRSLAGRPVPVTKAPTKRPAVDGTVTMLLAAVVTALAIEKSKEFRMICPFAVRPWPPVVEVPVELFALKPLKFTPLWLDWLRTRLPMVSFAVLPSLMKGRMLTVLLPPVAVTEFSVTTVSVEPAPLMVMVPPCSVTALVAATRVGVGFGCVLRPKLSQFSVP